MTDQVNNLTPAGGDAAPQDQTSAPETSTEAGQENAQRPITQADLAAFGDNIFKRLQQSSKDRNKKVEAELNSIKDRLNAAGVQISPEQQQEIRNKIHEDIDARDEEPQAGQPTPAAIAPEAQFVFDQISRVYQKAGVTVTPNDPEYKLVQTALDDKNGSLAETLLAADAAARQKAQRLAQNQQQAPARTLTGGATTNNGTPTAKTAKQLWGEAYRN